MKTYTEELKKTIVELDKKIKEEYEKILIENEVIHSYSKKGYPYDNASMESFNAILKKEEVNVNTYKTFKVAINVKDFL